MGRFPLHVVKQPMCDAQRFALCGLGQNLFQASMPCPQGHSHDKRARRPLVRPDEKRESFARLGLASFEGAQKGAMFDYDKCISRLIDLVARINTSTWTPTPESKALGELANKLDQTASLLAEHRWIHLEEAFNADPPPDIGFDGMPIKNTEYRAGKYAGLYRGIEELAEFARKEKEKLPNARKKRAVKVAALGLLHVRYQCGHGQPSLYDQGEEVTALLGICEKANMVLSRERLRGLLKEALDTFDPTFCSNEIAEIFVLSQ